MFRNMFWLVQCAAFALGQAGRPQTRPSIPRTEARPSPTAKPKRSRHQGVSRCFTETHQETHQETSLNTLKPLWFSQVNSTMNSTWIAPNFQTLHDQHSGIRNCAKLFQLLLSFSSIQKAICGTRNLKFSGKLHFWAGLAIANDKYMTITSGNRMDGIWMVYGWSFFAKCQETIHFLP